MCIRDSIPTGHELAEWVQDPLLRRLIAGGTLSRVVRYIGGFPGGLGALSLIHI